MPRYIYWQILLLTTIWSQDYDPSCLNSHAMNQKAPHISVWLHDDCGAYYGCCWCNRAQYANRICLGGAKSLVASMFLKSACGNDTASTGGVSDAFPIELGQVMAFIRILLVLASILAWTGGTPAQTTPARVPGTVPEKTIDLSLFKLQTLDDHMQFTELSSINEHQDPYFFTYPKTNILIFRVPSGAGHSMNSEYPRVELRQKDDWTMDAHDGRLHGESLMLRVMAEPRTGKLIFAQIHGERTATEMLKMRWTHGTISMGVKPHPEAGEQEIDLLHGVSLGSVFECRIEVQNDTVTVHLRTSSATATHSFRYDAESWKDSPLYFKAGNYSQDKNRDGSIGIVAIQRLELTQ